MSPGSRLVLAESVLSIRSVITYPLSVPQPTASGRTGFVNSLVVEIVTADGRSGFGESCPPVSPRATACLVEDALAPVLLGADESDIGALWQKMRNALVTPPQPIEWTEPEEAAAIAARAAAPGEDVIRH